MKQAPPAPALDWCLFLDVDGTLVELNDTPSAIKPDTEMTSLLRDVAERLGGAVALISGRKIENLDQLFAPLKLPAAGLHGVERRTADGHLLGANFVDAKLNGARTAIKRLVEAHPGILVEDKDRTVAVHYRTAPQHRTVVTEAMAGIAAALGPSYHIQRGNMLLEIKPCEFSKATAIEAFMQEPPFSGRRPVFAGDDLTDQDGFAVIDAHGGISIEVGDRVCGRFHLDDVAAVRRWLRGICA